MTTPETLLALKSAVVGAIAALRAAYGDDRIRIIPDGQGGAWVEILEVEIGDAYLQETTFVVFLLPFNLPGQTSTPCSSGTISLAVTARLSAMAYSE